MKARAGLRGGALLVAVAAACGPTPTPASPTTAPPAAAAGALGFGSADLRPESRPDGSAGLLMTFVGKTPGDCCVGPVAAALKTLGPGVLRTGLRAGEPRFLVVYDPARVAPRDLVAAFKASGEPVAPVRPEDR